MQRITAKDVRVTFGRLQAIYPAATNWTIQEGSRINGQCWRLFAKNPNGGLTSVIGPDGYLGYTAREAHLVLNGIITGIMLELDDRDFYDESEKVAELDDYDFYGDNE